MSNGEMERNQSILIKTPPTPRIGLILLVFYILSIYKNVAVITFFMSNRRIEEREK